MNEKLADVRDTLAAAASGGQREMSNAIEAVRNLLHAHGFSFDETWPLHNLSGALVDASAGKRHPLLTVNGNAGNSPNTMDAEFKGLAAAITTLISRRSGESIRTARAKVSDRLKQAGINSKVGAWHHEAIYRREQREVQDAYQENVSRMGDLDELGVENALATLVTRGRVKL